MSAPAPKSPARTRLDQALIAASIAALVLLALKCAWVCDDAYISFRVVDNLFHGHGPRWNVAERVQAFTHPLWLGAMAAAHWVSREVYFTSIALGLATTALVAWLLAVRLAHSTASGVLALLVLCCSKAFVDYSTSGLENPLLHLTLLGAFASVAERRTLAEIGLWVSAAALTRVDSLVLLAPAVLFAFSGRASPRALAAFAAGLAPLLAWELFSLVYYGALTPNTAIAKLNTGLGAGELAQQGLRYLLDSLARDPLTLVAIAAALVLCFARRERFAIALAAGVVLHLVYLVSIGGDFMSGRFLTAPLCCAAFALARFGAPSGRWTLAGVLASVLLAASTPTSPLRAPLDYSRGRPPAEHVGDSGIADERAFWYAAGGLFSPARASHPPPYRHVSQGHGLAFRLRDERSPPLVIEGIGYLGYWAGPGVHLVDPMGLSDAFLARLPIVVDGQLVRPDKNTFRGQPWRVGHYYRDVPAGYLEWLRGEPAAFADEELAQLHADVLSITRGELFTRERWSAIARRLR